MPLELATRDTLVRRALYAMQHMIDAPLTIGALAMRIHVSRRKLERHFTETLATTPSEVCKVLRLTHAEWLLSRTQRTIAQIAQDTGFTDASHFIRIFRARHGQLPQPWRAGRAHITA